MKPIIQFSHANGFPGSCYQQLYAYLEDEYNVRYVDTFGSNPKYPVTDNWPNLVQELIDTIQNNQQDPQMPVIGVGHSLGGVLTLLAAIQQPQLFSCIVVLDSPIFNFPKSLAVRWLKKIDCLLWWTPGRKTKTRREYWPDRNNCLTYLQNRALFKNFDKRCLQDYVDNALVPHPQGMTLKITKATEIAIYNSLPDNISRYAQQLQIPCGAILGETSNVVTKRDQKAMKNLFNVEFTSVVGGHLFPFEFPQAAANSIKQCIKNLNRSPGYGQSMAKQLSSIG